MQEKETLLQTLKTRFEQNALVEGLTWAEIENSLNDEKLKALAYMESTGGEPNVVQFNGELYFFDCSDATPAGRRNVCYDEKARLARKKFPPESSAEKEIESLSLTLMTEDQYFYLQSLKPVDEKTSSWLLTEPSVRAQGGAIFGNHHYGRTFIYHNGADSYYAVRGFRCVLKL